MSLKAVLSEEEFNELDESFANLFEFNSDRGQYELKDEIVKEHPGWSKVKKSADQNKKTAEQKEKELSQFRKKFGPLADAEDIDLSEYDEDQLEPVLKYLRGETDTPPAGGGQPSDPKGKNGVDVDKIKANARKPLERERDEIAKERDQLRNQLNSMVVDNALNAALSEIQVQGPYHKYLHQAFKSMVKVDHDDDGNPTAMIEGEYGEQPVNKYLKDWVQTDEGRAFVVGNNGSGAPGSKQSYAKGPNPWMTDQWNTTEQARIAREEPEKAKKMATAAGKTPPRV